MLVSRKFNCVLCEILKFVLYLMYELSKIQIRIKMGIVDIASNVMLKVIEIIIIDCDCFELEVEMTFDYYEW